MTSSVITQFPVKITQPGKYILSEDITIEDDCNHDYLIWVAASGVCIDLNCHLLDLKHRVRFGIIVVEQRDVIITNGIIRNARLPAEAINVVDVSQNLQSGIGIALVRASNVIINTLLVSNCFVGIYGYDAISNVVVDNCEFYDNGFNYGTPQQVNIRGGAVAFVNPSPQGALSLIVTNCKASSQVAQFGFAAVGGVCVRYENNSVEGRGLEQSNAVIACQLFGNEGLSVCQPLPFPTQITTTDPSVLRDINLYANFIINSTACWYIKNCMSCHNQTGYFIGNCSTAGVLEDSLATAYGRRGFHFLASNNAYLLNSKAIYPIPQVLLATQEAQQEGTIGILIDQSNAIHVKNNVVSHNCQLGPSVGLVVTEGSKNNSIVANTIFDNPIGIFNQFGFGSNIFLHNLAYANQQNYINVPLVVSLAENGTAPVAPYVNLMP